jgi:hypothetical protein
MSETDHGSATVNFLLGFGAGIGAGLAMFVLTLLLGRMLERPGYATFFDNFRGFALVWGISSAALFAYVGFSTSKKRPSVFRAGLVTAFALIALLDAACWNFHF